MIGAIADDFTGATDVAAAFRRSGLRTVILFDQPAAVLDEPDADVVVIGLKTRTVEAGDAVAQSLRAAQWLLANGAEQLYFKICSTFDSRDDGNIGPVADALAELVDATVVPVAPSTPEHERTQYLGHLFVGDVLLSESHMRHHPLTPMTRSSVVELLARQTDSGVSLAPLATVRAGAEALRATLTAAEHGYVVLDATSDDDLLVLGRAVVELPLVIGAAGLAAGLGRAAAQGRPGARAVAASLPTADQPAAAIAGSCSARTLLQIERMIAAGHPVRRLEAREGTDAARLAAEALDWFDVLPGGPAPLFSSSLPPEQLAAVQRRLGVAHTSALLEEAMGLVARGLRDRGVRRLVVAGGETSGAVTKALGVSGGLIGSEAAPGVPWIRGLGDDPMTLLLKSGNFGDPDFLVETVAGRAAEAVA